MGRIRVLDDVLANQIAAGEVVERPASVVKELLENSLDAGATAVTVELAGGGVTLLRVVDDGHGMDREDARLALQRHATSKITQASDLHHIRTLGFRGEALPSIASVSRFTLRTRQPGDVGAVQLKVEGGKDLEVRDAPGPVGTDIRVEDLFFNVPARRKFLKKPATETSHVQEAVQRLALCYPQVAFRFVKEGRTAFDLPRHPTLLDRVRAIFGKRITQRLVAVELDGMPGVDGLIGPPDEARATARHYHTFINGRYVRDRVVMSAIQSAYGSRLERGRHPFVVLRLSLPPEALDVNVHPAKTEVRYVDGGGVHRLVSSALDRTLRTDPWQVDAPEATPDDDGERAYRIPAADGEAGGLAGHRRRIFDAMERIAARRPSMGGFTPRPPTGEARRPPAQMHLGVDADSAPRPLRLRPSSGGPVRAEVFEPPARPRNPWPTAPADRAPPWPTPGGRPVGPPPAGEAGSEDPAESRASSPPMPPPMASATLPDAGPRDAPSPPRPLHSLGTRPALDAIEFGALRPLGPVDRVLLCAAADGLVGLDVVEARARLLYDRLRRGEHGRTLGRPVSIELDGEQRQRLSARAETLTAMGFVVEPFGGATHVVQQVPQSIDAERAIDAVRAALAAEAEDVAAAVVQALPDTRAIGPHEADVVLAALDAVEHPPPKPGPLVFALTTAELTRLLR